MRIVELKESGTIYDKKNFDPDDPEVLVHGYGRLRLSQLHRKISEYLSEMSEKAALGNMDFVDYQMNRSPLGSFIKAAQDVEKELNSPAIKRKITLMRKTS